MTTDIIHAYRHLYRSLLHAVQFSSPARYIARDQLRAAFREAGTGTGTFDAEATKRTIWFLEAAARERGLEHRILKNLLRMRGNRGGVTSWKQNLQDSKERKSVGEEKDFALLHYDMTVAMLNRSMGTCLR